MKKTITIMFFIINSLTLSQEVPDEWKTYFEKSGYKSTPDYKETIIYFQKLADNSEFAELKTFGISPQGREMKYLVVNSEKNFDAEKIKNSGQPVVLFINGIHSGEIEGKDASMILLKEILITGEKKELISNVTLLVVPVFSVDAHERRSSYNRINQNGPEEMGWRVTSQNLNLNRDWMKADAPEMQSMLKLVNEWNPDFIVDSHTTDGADYQYTLTYSVEKFSNIFYETADWLKNKFIPYFENGVEKDGYLVHPYVYLKNWQNGLDDGIIDWASSPRLSTGYFALRNRPSLLIETHMIKPYKERVFSTKSAFETVLKFINENKNELIELNKKADTESIKLFTKKKIFLPVSFTTTDKYVFEDIKGYKSYKEFSDISGDMKLVYTDEPEVLKVKFYNELTVIDSVSLPDAYIIPKEWSEVIKRLKLHNIGMQELSADTTINVTAYRFKDVKYSTASGEGRQRVSFQYNTEKKSVHFSAGDFVVKTAQPNIRIIAGLLEPKSGDSFIQWGFFNSTFERIEYFENYVMEKLAERMLSEDQQLKEEFEQKLKEDEESKNDPAARLNFFYEKSPYRDDKLNLYPVYRIE